MIVSASAQLRSVHTATTSTSPQSSVISAKSSMVGIPSNARPASDRPEVHDDDLAALLGHLPFAASLLGKAEVGGQERRT